LFDPDGKLVVKAAKNLDLAFKDATLKAGKAEAVEVKSTFDVPAGKVRSAAGAAGFRRPDDGRA
jgi:hypothetical protein